MYEHTPHSGPPIPAEHMIAVVEAETLVDVVVVGWGVVGGDDELGATVVVDDVVVGTVDEDVVSSEQFAPVYPR